MSVYDIVTAKILDQLAQGNIPWIKPWKNVRPSHNRISQKEYSLINQLLLSDKPPGEYASARQWRLIGGKIREGESQSPSIVVFWKCVEKESNDQEPEMEKNKVGRPVLMFHKIYHISQIDGVEPLETNYIYPTNPIGKSEDLFKNYVSRENITFKNDLTNRGAFYSPQLDMIHLPHPSQFPETSGTTYAQTLWHECIHSSGHAKRLNRPGLQDVVFGSAVYSREELCAEIGSCFILNKLGILDDSIIKNSSAYIQGWSKYLTSDPRALVKAASDAEKAVNFILGN